MSVIPILEIDRPRENLIRHKALEEECRSYGREEKEDEARGREEDGVDDGSFGRFRGENPRGFLYGLL